MADHEEALAEFRKRVKERFGDRVKKIILFGSVARGDETEESDVDVLVIVDDRRAVEGEIIGIAFDVMLETDVYVSPKVISAAHFKKMQQRGGNFIREVEREMKVYA